MKDAGRYTKERRGRSPELRRRRYLKLENVFSTDTACTETGAVPKNQEVCRGWIYDEAGGGVPRYPRSGHQHVLAPEDLRYSAQDYGGEDFSQSWTSELWTLP